MEKIKEALEELKELKNVLKNMEYPPDYERLVDMIDEIERAIKKGETSISLKDWAWG